MTEVLDRLRTLLAAHPAGARFCVGLSGGLDSTVLLHGLASLRQGARFGLRALHVNHGLHAAAGDWQRRCEALCRSLDVPCKAIAVAVASGRGRGPEAEAREARYGAFETELLDQEILLTAHHEDDQLETILLHLARGSGVTGLAGIPADVPFARGRLCRPLLAVPRPLLLAYAEAAALTWVEDPANADTALDRNYLRRRVIPLLRERWPALGQAAGRSAAFCGEATGLLDELAGLDAATILQGASLCTPGLRALGGARQRNLLRYVARRRGWAVPPEARLREGLRQLLDATPGRQPVLRWPGGEIRRYRDRLYFLDATGPLRTDDQIDWPAPSSQGEGLDLGPVRGRLWLHPVLGQGLDAGLVDAGLCVAFRSGGEGLRAAGDGHHRTLKYLFQRRGIVPWMRPHIPLVYSGGRLVAVADLWLDADAAAGPGKPGFLIHWQGHGPID